MFRLSEKSAFGYEKLPLQGKIMMKINFPKSSEIQLTRIIIFNNNKNIKTELFCITIFTITVFCLINVSKIIMIQKYYVYTRNLLGVKKHLIAGHTRTI